MCQRPLSPRPVSRVQEHHCVVGRRDGLSLDITPAALAEEVGRRTVLQLLRSGVRPQEIALRLRERDHGRRE